MFRISENVAFGMARELDRTIPHNFAVTGLINRFNIHSYEERNYDAIHTNLNYLSFFDEVESFYGVYPSLEKARILDKTPVQQVTGNYYTACEELKTIIEDNLISLHENLDAAETAEQKLDMFRFLILKKMDLEHLMSQY